MTVARTHGAASLGLGCGMRAGGRRSASLCLAFACWPFTALTSRAPADVLLV